MQFLKKSWFNISVVSTLILLFFTQCSDSQHTQKDIIKETIKLNKHQEEEIVTKPIIKTNPEVEKFKKQRDEAVERTSAIREKNTLLEKKIEELNKKIEELKADQEKTKTEFHTKLAASSRDFLEAKALSDSKDKEIQKLTKQRDEALKKVSTSKTKPIPSSQPNNTKQDDKSQKLQQEIDKLSTKITHLQDKVAGLSKENTLLKNTIMEKNAEISSTIYDKKDEIKRVKKEFNLKKDEEIQKLTQEKNEAIKVSLGMKSQLDSLANKLSHTQEKLQSAIKDKQSLQDSLKNSSEEESKNLTLFKTKLSSLEKLLSTKDKEIQKLTQQRDEAIESAKDCTK